MLRKRNASAPTSTDDSGENANGLSYGVDTYGHDDETAEEEYDEEEYDEDDEYSDEAEAEYDADEDAEAEGEYDEDAEYDEETDGEYVEGEYDEDADYDDEEYEDEEQEDFTPPTAASALKRSWLAPRPRAQPATGTEQDAKKVNFLDRRETWIGYFLGVMLVALAVTSYYFDRHYIDKKNLTLQREIHHEAPWILGITLVLAVLILLATYFKRRAAVGFTLLLAGVALFNSDFLIGIIYLGTGLWLVFRAMKRNPRAQAAGAARGGSGATRAGTARGGGRGATAGGRRTTTSATTTSSSMRAANAPRVSSSATRASTQAKSTTSGRQIGRNGRLASDSQAAGRYTKPKSARHVPPKVQPEPEPTNRLSAWLKK